MNVEGELCFRVKAFRARGREEGGRTRNVEFLVGRRGDLGVWGSSRVTEQIEGILQWAWWALDR